MKAIDQQTVSVVNPCEAIHTAGDDYAISCEGGLYKWRGLESGYGYEAYFSSGPGWRSPEAAQCDALYSLAGLDGDEHETTMQMLANLRFFTPAVLNVCAEQNLNYDFSELEAAPDEVIVMTSAAELRGELEKLAEAGNVSPDDYLRCWQVWQVLKEQTTIEYYPVIIDRLNALLSATIPPAQGEAGEIGALARATIAAMNSTDLVLDEMKATYSQRFSH